MSIQEKQKCRGCVEVHNYIPDETISCCIDGLVKLGDIAKLINFADQIPFKDICSKNYALICCYKRQLEAKDYEGAFLTATKIHNRPVQDIAFKRIAFGLTDVSKMKEAIVMALNVFDAVDRDRVIKDVRSKAKDLNVDFDSILESLTFSAIESDNEYLVMRVIENSFSFIPDKDERNKFLIACVQDMVTKQKYKMALSILNYLSIGNKLKGIEEEKKYRKRAFNIIFDPILERGDYRLILALSEAFKEQSILAHADTQDSKSYNYYLINSMLCNIIDLLLAENKFDLLIRAVKICGSNTKSCQLNNILMKFFQKNWQWQAANYKTILLFADELSKAEGNSFQFIDVQLRALCNKFIKNKSFNEAHEVALHIKNHFFIQALHDEIENAIKIAAVVNCSS